MIQLKKNSIHALLWVVNHLTDGGTGSDENTVAYLWRLRNRLGKVVDNHVIWKTI